MQKRTNILRKYSSLFAAVFVFLLISAGLIYASLYQSNRYAQASMAQDLSGYARANTQLVLRHLFEIDRAQRQGQMTQPEKRKSLRERSELIGRAFQVLREGGKVPGQENVYDDYIAVDSPERRKQNERLQTLWTPYAQLLKPINAPGEPSPAALAAALDYAEKHNTEILDILSAMLNEAMADAGKGIVQLARAQMIGGALILLNFIFLVVFALRRLVAGDRAVEQSNKQTDDILHTVREGLFLVTPDLGIGERMSRSLPQIMQRKIDPGMNLIEVLRTMVTPQTLEATRDYLGLLFGKRVKENLVASLNPLSEVPVAGGSDGRGQPQSRYLNFQFNRVQQSEDTVYLLVTVSDASERVRLTNEIAAAKTRTREEMEALLRVLSRESSEVRFFLHRVGAVLERINDDLRQAAARRTGTDYSELVNAIFRDVHSLKSEAAALNLEMVEALAHNFELDLIHLRDRGSVEGGDMVKMTVHLDDMFECVATIRDFLDRISGSRDASAPAPSAASASQRAVEGWGALAERIAREQGKQVSLDMQLQAFDRLPGETLNALRTVGLQLLRNSVVHGIEPAAERLAIAKPAVGTISFRAEDVGSRQIELVVRDDGRGIDARRVRAALAASGRYPPDQVQAFSDREAIMKIFEPGVSTAESGDRDAGHGVGMDLVMKQVRSMSGTISLATKVGAYTEFRIRLPVAEPQPAAASSAPADSGDFQLTF
ncbi:ATP-binding protein [Pseudomonas sp. CGJS7]|uniref:ATP-binding protein n=1 Tax=Pseudomonas sp. CGJS7 TaxID=3109348 RepID=UPI003009BC1D